MIKQKQILSSNRHENLEKHNNEDFFIQLFNAYLHFINSNFPNPTSIEKILIVINQPILLIPHS